MKLPRDVSADTLIQLLRRYDYRETRQTGSHIRLTTLVNGEHHVTIPRHSHLRVGTLHAILQDIASHLDLDWQEFSDKLFSKRS
jgi:predicted RNA binding protein YcfA (HicA-like mRNA interferase family)